MGGLLIQPEIFTIVGWQRPIAGVHYLACRDDFSDLRDLIDGVLAHPDRYLAMRLKARQFWIENCSVAARWQYVSHCIDAITSEFSTK
jgi:hypothetical protein